MFGLIKEAFDFYGNKEKVQGLKNFKQAKVFLRPTNIKETINKIKSGENPKIGENTKDNILTSIHIAKKVASNKRIKQETRDQAIGLLNKAGIDLTSLGKQDNELLKNARSKFEENYTGANKASDKESRPEENNRENKKTQVQEPISKSSATRKRPVAPEKKEREEPEESDERQPQEEPKDDSETKPEPEKTPTQIVSDIKRLKQNTSEEIQGVIDKLKTSEDMAAKRNLQKVNNLLRKFENKMNRLENKAKAGPRNAADAINQAKTESKVASNNAIRIPLPGAIRRIGMKGAESLKKAKKAAETIAKRTGEKIQKSETLNKIAQTTQKVGEKIKSTSQKGVEKVIDRSERANKERNYRLIYRYLGAEKANQYLENPAENLEFVKQAQNEQIRRGETVKNRLKQTTQNIKQKIINKGRVNRISDKIKQKFMPRRKLEDKEKKTA